MLACALKRRKRRTSDVVQHAQPQQWIGKTQDSSSDDRGPIGCLPVAGECKPEEGDWEQPDGHEGDEESCFGAVGAMNLAIAGIEPGLYGDEEEHDRDSDDEIEIGEIGSDITDAC